MKMKHDVDATSIKRRAKTAAAGIALAAAVTITATSIGEAVVHVGAKARHDAMRGTGTGQR